MKLVEQSILLVRVHLIDRKKERLAGARQQPSQFAIGPRNLGASIDDHDNGRRFVKRDLGLTEYFRRNEVFVVSNDATGIDDAKLVPAPFHLAIQAVTTT